MTETDPGARDLCLRVVVMGGASEAFLAALKLQGDRLPLGRVHDFELSLRFEAFGVDPWAGEGAGGAALERAAHQLDALVLTDALSPGTHYSSSAVERLCRALQPARVVLPTVIYGGPALAMEWQSLTGVVPVMVCDPLPENALSAAKALAKAALRALRKSEPPPSVRG
ncbi:MAG: hypothetical protein IT377_02815 [Polyangiaceae bacterium]|nr:hypothetical protein [Polyangiaceae bacterium]